jgi:periplasmic protein TonB
MSRTFVFTVSVGVHAALAFGLGGLRSERTQAATAIEIAEVAAPKPPEAVKIDPPEPPPKEAPKQHRAAPRPAALPQPEAEQPQAAGLEDVPDFGLALEGVSGGGIAVPQAATQRSAAPSQPVQKQLKSLAPVGKPALSGCSDAPSKPRPISVPQPAYTEAARSAGIEGRVRVQLTVDEHGAVVNVKVLQGLGHGLDEAALNAAKAARFEAATQCGKPVSATFTISMRFSAS